MLSAGVSPSSSEGVQNQKAKNTTSHCHWSLHFFWRLLGLLATGQVCTNPSLDDAVFFDSFSKDRFVEFLTCVDTVRGSGDTEVNKIVSAIRKVMVWRRGET